VAARAMRIGARSPPPLASRERSGRAGSVAVERLERNRPAGDDPAPPPAASVSCGGARRT
jgi:hypothetical protein